MQLLFRQPIRRQLMVATIVLAVPLAAALVWTANATRLEQQAVVKEQAASVAATAAAQLDSYLAGLDALASAVARHPVVVSLDGEQASRLFADLLRGQPLVTNLILLRPDGRVLATAAPLPPGFERVDWTIIPGVVRTKQPAVTDFATSPISGKSVVALAYPVQDEQDAVVGVLVLGIDLVRLQTVFASVPLPQGSVISVVDRQGVVIARSAEADRFIGQNGGVPPVTPGAPPVTSLRTGVDGGERFYGDVAARQGAWTVSVGIPRGVVLARLLPVWSRNLGIAVASKGTGLGLSVSYGIIEACGGTIGYRGNDWGGATFFFELPATEAGSAQTHDRSAVLHGSV